eukprot:GHVP01011669.1.p1 GENE.GHVP01011669.1~~GHVP01011669.1.p1  ORF type:complete len:111 (-),score=3.99 GHVP01011669.1:435-767(-)
MSTIDCHCGLRHTGFRIYFRKEILSELGGVGESQTQTLNQKKSLEPDLIDVGWLSRKKHLLYEYTYSCHFVKIQNQLEQKEAKISKILRYPDPKNRFVVTLIRTVPSNSS